MTGGETNAKSARKKWRKDEGEKKTKRKSVKRTADVVKQPHRQRRQRNAKILHDSFLCPLLCELSRIVVIFSRRIKAYLY